MGWPLSLGLALFLTNCSEALIAAVGMRWLSAVPVRFDTLRRVVMFLISAVLMAPLLSSFADAAAVMMLRGEPYWLVWRTRLFSNILTELTLVPALVMVITAEPAWLHRASRARYAEGDTPCRSALHRRHRCLCRTDQRPGCHSRHTAHTARLSPAIPPLGHGALRTWGHQLVTAGDRAYSHVGSLAGVWTICWTAASRECPDAPALPGHGCYPAHVSGGTHRGAPARRSRPGETATFRGNAVSPLRSICTCTLARPG
jgi:hypothetical protein